MRHTIWIVSALMLWLLAGLRTAEARVPGLPNYTHPTDPQARAEAEARVWEVYYAIDAATQDLELRAELKRICRRESSCNWIKQVTWHEGDSSGGRARWRAAVSRGLLQPDRCPEHEMGDPARWTSYGPFGIASAWTVRYLGDCVGPSALDDPRKAAVAAVAWIDSLCRRQGACSCEERTKWWVGPGIWSMRSRWSQLSSVQHQCAQAIPWWRWAGAFFVDAVDALDQPVRALTG